MRDLEPRRPVHRYEHQRPAICCTWTSRSWAASAGRAIASPAISADRTRRVGWEYLHVAIDDHSRIAFSAIFAQ
jgi:hypothetical protein